MSSKSDALMFVVFFILWFTVLPPILRKCNEFYTDKWDTEEARRSIRECEFKGLYYTSKWGSGSREYLCPDSSYKIVGPNVRNAKGE